MAIVNSCLCSSVFTVLNYRINKFQLNLVVHTLCKHMGCSNDCLYPDKKLLHLGKNCDSELSFRQFLAILPKLMRVEPVVYAEAVDETYDELINQIFIKVISLL